MTDPQNVFYVSVNFENGSVEPEHHKTNIYYSCHELCHEKHEQTRI